MVLSLPRGTSDFGPIDAIKLNAMRSTVEGVFRLFGFYPIETPAIELMEVLNAKAYGEESKNEIYVLEGNEEGLRYDFTVPLSRFIAMNKDLQMPFKRYQIGNIWRKDEPQKMRHREFMQADIDIIGSAEVASDAEVIAAASMAIERLGLHTYNLFLNSRVFLDAILDMFNIPADKHSAVMRCIDKIEKLGVDEISSQIQKEGIDVFNAKGLLDFITKKYESNTTLLMALEAAVPKAKDEIKRMTELLALLEKFGISGAVSIDLSLARGLEYYTGAVWELVAFSQGKRLPTLASGGRYDKLIGLYLKKDVPAVGFSIGITRVFDFLKEGSSARTYATVYIASIKKENLEYAIMVATSLRSSGIATDMNITERSISKQMEYANALKIPFVIVLGNIERQSNKVKLRNMQNGEEKMMSVEECISELKSKNDVMK
jgi:histidyl-tRNA synthetase